MPLNSSGREMQRATKEKALLAFAVASLIFCVFMFLDTTKIIPNISAVEASGVGVYWDSNCSNKVSSIDWSALNPGSVENRAVYIRNEEEEPMYLTLSTTNWNPPEASEYLKLGWNYTSWRMNPDEVLQITLTLSVSRYIHGISSFSFDILVAGSDRLLGDMDGNGKIDILDVKLVRLAYSGLIELPSADVNGDGEVNVLDLRLVQLALSGIL